MNAVFIRGLLRARPFEPFKVIMLSGDSFIVKRPELGFLAGSRLIIYVPETDTVDICSLLHIADIKMDHMAA